MASADKQSVEAQVIAALAETLGIDASAIDPGVRFSDYGLTSLSAARLTARLATQLERELPATLLWDYQTSRRLASFLCGEDTERRSAGIQPMADDEPIAIVGMACRLPGANDPESFWKNLLDGVESVGDMSPERMDVAALYDPDPQKPGCIATRRGGFLQQVDAFDAAFFGMSPREAIEVDPQQRLVLELAWEVLERAGIAPANLHGTRTGVFMGAMWSEYGQLAGGIEAIAQHSATGRDTGIIANRVSYTLGLTGPSLTVNTACSSSLVAIHLACRSLRSGESTLALAGGVNLMLSPESTVAMTKFGAMAPDGRSKAFDARANGYVRGEGGGVVLLKPLWRAVADGDNILALLRGSAINNDGPSNGLTAPNPDAQRAVLRDACADAGIDPADVDYVEAHGTGTMLGDPIEAGALGAVLGSARAPEQPLLIGSVKTNIGHLEAAAGVSGLIKTVLALRQRIIPRSLHLESPNPHIDFKRLNLEVAASVRPWPVRDHPPCAGVSSFGFGGTNAHVVLQAWQGEERKNAEGLIAAYAAPTLTQSTICRSGASREESRQETEDKTETQTTATKRPLVFIYTGNGAQWPGMGRNLLASSPEFRAAVEACDAAFRELGADFSVLDELAAVSGENRRGNTITTQATMFALQIGLTRLLRARGFVPQAVIGHSLGEVAAAHAAGALSLPAAAKVVLQRSRLQAQAAGNGAMAVLELPWQETEQLLEQLLAEHGEPAELAELTIAGSNAPTSTTVAGSANAIKALLAELETRGIAAQRIRVDVAYHSPAMDPLCTPLAAALDGLPVRSTHIPFHSTVEARVMSGEELDADYWVRNLRLPVRFSEAFATLPDGVFVEIAPHPILRQSAEHCLAHNRRSGPVLACMARDETPRDSLQALLQRLSQEGVASTPASASTSITAPRPSHLLTLSAKSEPALLELARNFSKALDEPLADACLTANTGRKRFTHRLAVVAPDAQTMRALLAQYADGQAPSAIQCGTASVGGKPALTLCFGAGAPRLSGLADFARHGEAFDEALLRLDPLFRQQFGASVHALLDTPQACTPEMQNALALAVAYAVATQLVAWGIRVDAFAGGGVGELSARLLRGELTLAEALHLAAEHRPQGVPTIALEKQAATVGIVLTFGTLHLDTSAARDTMRLPMQDGAAWASVLDLLAALFVAGCEADWKALDRGLPRRRQTLPTYAFQRQRYWPKAATQTATQAARPLGTQSLATPNAPTAPYGLDWLPRPRPTAMPDPAQLLASLSAAPVSSPLPAALDRLAAAYAAASLRSDTRHTAPDPTGERSIAERRHLAALQRLAALSTTDSAEDAETLAAALRSEFPAAHAEIDLIQAAGRNLPSVLENRAAAFDLLFPGGSMEPLYALYERSPFAATIARWTREAFAAALQGRDKPRIVEIGAGTGGTTAHLLPRLPPEGHYLFTDVSRAFLTRAEARFGNHPGFASALLDIESPPGLQGIAGEHDMAIAINVLHATCDLRATLTGVHALLRRGGLLLLGEITAAPGWLDLVFGMLDGWWRFTDDALRSESALLDAAQWQALLGEAGFETVAITADHDRQSLIVARAGPRPGRRLILGTGQTAQLLRDGLLAHGIAAEVHASSDALPAQGEWLETLLCDSDESDQNDEPPATACATLQQLFAAPRFGRITLAHETSSDLDRATTQAAREAYALSVGAADPLRWGGALQFAPGCAAMLLDTLLDRLPEDRVRLLGNEPEVARLLPLPRQAHSPAEGLPLRPDRSYLITGGLGTLGLAFAQWLAGRGARHLALLGRQPPSPTAEVILQELRANGTSVRIFAADVTDPQALAQVLHTLAIEAPPLAGVVHAAGSSSEDPAVAFAAKLDGARLLDTLTRPLALDFFLLFSSAAGTWGTAAKPAYAAANAALDALAAWRRQHGLPALALAWGRFSVRGLLTEAEDATLAEMGLLAMPPAEAFTCAWPLTASERSTALVARVDWPRFRAVCEARSPRPLLRALPQAASEPANKTPASIEAALADRGSRRSYIPKAVEPSPFVGAAQAAMESNEPFLETTPAHSDTPNRVRQLVAEQVAQVLGHDDAAALPSTQGLFDLGLDSLLAVQLRSRLETAFGRPVPTAVLFSHPSIKALSDWLLEAQDGAMQTSASPRPSTPPASCTASTAIAVIGIGCRFPGGVTNLDSFERLLFDGGNAISEVPGERWDWRDWAANVEDGSENTAAPNRWGGFLDEVDRFDAAFFGIPPKEAAFMDPQQRLLLETAWEAIEHAGIAPPALTGSAAGVFVGITGSDYAALTRRDRSAGLEAQAIVGQPANAAAGRIAFTLGLTGPAFVVDTACSSSLVAIHLACRALRAGECSSALAGGVNLMLSPETSVILAHAGMLSPHGQCRAFDASADGFVRAEGCAMVLLKPLQAALQDGDRVLAVVRGSAVNHDGRASGFTVPNGRAQEVVMRAALDDAGLPARNIAYIEAHGTGTPLGDPIEAQALAGVYGERPAAPLLLGSVKSNIGHAESAAGVAGFIKAVIALRRGRIPATLHFERLNPHIPPDGKLAVPDQAVPFPEIEGRRIAAVSAFGASGTNAHLVLEAGESSVAPNAPITSIAPAAPKTLHLLTLSAGHADSLGQLARRVGELLDEQADDSNPGEIAYAAARCRSSLPVRGFAVIENAAQGRSALAGMTSAKAEQQPRVAFLYTGQGSQYADMARGLYQGNALFRETFDRCADIASPLLGTSLADIVFASEADRRLNETRFLQPALFAVGCALSAVWREQGVVPYAVLGHSVGEFAAAVSAGVLSLEDATRLVVARGQLMHDLPGKGGMLAVRAGTAALLPLLAREPELSLAAENALEETVLAGPPAALERLRTRLEALGIVCRPLNTSHAFHSAQIEPMLGALAQVAQGMTHARPTLNFISSLTGTLASSLTPEYWPRQAREAVRFAQALRCAAGLGCTVFIEIGPQPVLTTLAGATLERVLALPSLRRGKDDQRTLLEAFGGAWQAGVEIVLPALQGTTAGRPGIELPTTPFRCTRHWLDCARVERSTSLGRPTDAQHLPDPMRDLIHRIDWQTQTLLQGKPAGNWHIVGSAPQTVPLAHALLQLGVELTEDERAASGTIWLAPVLTGDDDTAQACAALHTFVQGAAAPVWVVTRAAQTVGTETNIDFRAAAFWGIGRALALGEPERWGGLIDLPVESDPQQDARLLSNFLASFFVSFLADAGSNGGNEDQAVLRAGTVFLPRLDKLPDPPTALPPLLAERSYLISGGFGGLGLALAQYLAENGARHIALIGRRAGEIPPALAEEFSRRGVAVRGFGADIADMKAMASVAAQIEATMPPVTAIFHAAGVKASGSIETLRPKLGGAQILHELSRQWPVESFVLFSSAASVWGDSSLPAYAAANATLDAFACWRRAQGLPALAVNWSRFDVRGMLDDRGAALFDRIGLEPLPASTAFDAMRRLSAAGIPQATVAAVRWQTFGPIHCSRRTRPLLARLAPPDASPTPETAANSAPHNLPGPAAPPLSGAALQERLSALVAAILGSEDSTTLDVNQGFFALGMDSFGIVDLRRRIEQELGIPLASAVLFEAPNIAALARRLSPQAEPLTTARQVAGAVANADPIAIIGVACRLPGGVYDLDGLERLLFDGRDAVGLPPPERAAVWETATGETLPAAYRRGGFLDDIASFDADFFGISPREAMQMDPQHRLLLELAWQALENAGWSPPTLAGSRTGVFVGITGSEYADLAHASGSIDAHAVGGQFLNAAAGRISHALGLRGPCLAVDTACSSSAMALHLACNALRAGECDIALAGGANLLLSPETSAMLARAKMLSPHGRCASFDAAADGYVRAEGCALVVLKRLPQALADGERILAVIRGTACNHDGASSGFTVPNGDAQQAVIRSALNAAGVAPGELSYVEAHGTGTALGDPIEMHALDAVFGASRQTPLLVGSIKTNIGHAEAAAGVAGLLKLLVALRRRHLPPHLHFSERNPHIQVPAEHLTVVAHGQPWEATSGRRIAGLSSFGASGTNVHLVVEEAPGIPQTSNTASEPLLALSARRAEDLAPLLAQLRRAPDLLRACRETTLTRSALPYRFALLGDDCERIRDAQLLENPAQQVVKQAVNQAVKRAGRPKIAFLFTGQGAQYAGMAAGLYRSQPVFRAAIDRCGAAMRDYLPAPLVDILFDENTPLIATARVQPALFAVSYALAQLWRDWGVQPEALIGHSVGEIAAACVAGALPLEAAAQLVCVRGRLMGALPAGGGMAAVLAPADVVAEILTETLASNARASNETAINPAAKVVIAARNAPENTVLSGDEAALQQVLAQLAQEGIRAVRLPVSHAFHSPLLEPMLDTLEQFAATLPDAEANIPLASNLDGQLRSRFDAAYWRAQARQPVAFAEGMATLAALGCDTFIEMGPQATLCGLGRACCVGKNWIASLERAGQGNDDAHAILAAATAAWQLGADIDWRRVLGIRPQDAAPLAPYPFRKTRHWLDGQEQTAGAPPAANSVLFSRAGQSPTFAGRVHACTLGRRDLPVLEDSDGLVHAGLHLAFIASALPPNGKAPAISDLQFERPLHLQAPRQLQLLLGNDGSISLYAEEADGSWVRYLRARLEDAVAPAADEDIDAAAIRARCVTGENADAFYARLAARGFPVGAGLRRIKQAWWREGEAIALVKGETGPHEPQAFGLAAGLFEACAQLAAMALPGHQHGYMLLGWERLMRSQRAGTASTWIHVRIGNIGDGATLQAQIGLYDANGQWLARIDGAVLRRVTGNRENAPRRAPWVGFLDWREVPVNASIAHGLHRETGRWTLLALDPAAQGEAQALRAACPELFQPEGGTGGSTVENAAENTLLLLSGTETQGEEARMLAEVAAAVRALPGGSRVLLVTRACCSPASPVGALDGKASGIRGLAQALRAERADLSCRCVDLSPDTDTSEALPAEIADSGPETETAWSGSRRFVARLAAWPSSEAKATDEKTMDEKATNKAPQRLYVRQTGSLDGLVWQTIDLPTPGADEVMIEVAAAAPGLRDALFAYGQLTASADDEAANEIAGNGIGTDCAGIVRAVGAAVERFRPGDAVLAYIPHGSGALATHLAVAARFVRHKPAHLNPIAAATVPLPYLTAWHALRQRAALQAGETVLVHCAGSAVGLAAGALARLIGARVIATASPPKQATLRAFGIEIVGDSRRSAFAPAVLAATGGRGVDVALGAFDASSRTALGPVLATGGRLIDLTRVGHDGGVNLDRLAAEHPADFERLFDAVVDALASGKLPPLPHETLPPTAAIAALRRLSLGSVIGRLCVSFTPVEAPQPQGTWLLTGANGGIGRLLIRHLLQRGVRHLLLLDRVPLDTKLLDELQALGAHVVNATLDIADESALGAIIERAGRELPPIGAIVHAAGAVADAPLAELEHTHFERTLAAKVEGARLLDRLSRKLPLAVFALFSSVVALLPSARQGAYAAANAALLQLARRRRAEGLPATAIAWGPWATGIGDALGARARATWEAWGVTPLAEDEALEIFDRFCAAERDAVVLDIDWERYGARLDAVPTLLEALLPARRMLTNSLTNSLASPLDNSPANPSPDDIPTGRSSALATFATLANLDDAALATHIEREVLAATAHVLRLGSGATVDAERPFSEQGMDSLMASEFADALGKAIGTRLPGTLVYNQPTPAAVTTHLVQRLRRERPEAPPSTGHLPPKQPPARKGSSESAAGSTTDSTTYSATDSTTDSALQRRLNESLARAERLLGKKP